MLTQLKRILFSLIFMGSKGVKAVACDSPISPEEAWSKIDEGAVVIDCRSPSECASGLLPGALNIPHTDTEGRINELGADKSKDIVVYCAVGGRASIARQTLLQNGFKHVYNAGGYKELESFGRSTGRLS